MSTNGWATARIIRIRYIFFSLYFSLNRSPETHHSRVGEQFEKQVNCHTHPFTRIPSSPPPFLTIVVHRCIGKSKGTCISQSYLTDLLSSLCFGGGPGALEPSLPFRRHATLVFSHFFPEKAFSTVDKPTVPLCAVFPPSARKVAHAPLILSFLCLLPKLDDSDGNHVMSSAKASPLRWASKST